MSTRSRDPGPRSLALALLAVIATGCGGEDGKGSVRQPSFHDLGGAPPAIQTASRAVVRIRTAGQSGTGSFVSATGLLMTNNHVLGAEVCPIEGCWVELAFLYQRGQPLQDERALFAVPVSVDVGLDVAFVQVYRSPYDRQPLDTPDFLTLSDRDAASLLGAHVTVVGHPEGRLKRWTDGVVVDAFGDWFTATAYILPGDSGSPVLDDGGGVVGIVHRGPTAQDLFTAGGANVYAIGTAAAPLAAARGAALPEAMVSVAAPATAEDVVARNLVYLNGGIASVSVDGSQVTVLSLLAEACDAALARTDFSSPDDLSAALAPCESATLWIECRSDATPPPYGVVCPSGADAPAWAGRYQMVNRLWVAMNGNTRLSPVSFGIAALSAFKDSGQTEAAQSLQAALASARQVLDFGILGYLAAFDIAQYAGTSTLDWLARYTERPRYQMFASNIVSAYLWFRSYGDVSVADTRAALDRLAGDPDVSLGAKLYIDEIMYRSGD